MTANRYSANFAKPASATAAADPRSAAYQRDMAALKATHAAYLADHPEVARAHDAAATRAGKGSATKNAGSKGASTYGALLRPIASVPGYQFRPEDPPNVKVLRTLYGESQLHAALSRYAVKFLRMSATFHNVTLPRNATKDQIIQTLMSHPNTQGTLPSQPLPAQRATVPTLRRLRASIAALSAS